MAPSAARTLTTEPPPIIAAADGTATHTYAGGCHCGRVRFTCLAPPPDSLVVTTCNCSFCDARGARNIYVKDELFTWTKGSWADLTAYRWNTRHVAHSFCPVCGIHVGSYVPAHGIVSVNMRSVDDVESETFEERRCDGKRAMPLVEKRPRGQP